MSAGPAPSIVYSKERQDRDSVGTVGTLHSGEYGDSELGGGLRAEKREGRGWCERGGQSGEDPSVRTVGEETKIFLWFVSVLLQDW